MARPYAMAAPFRERLLGGYNVFGAGASTSKTYTLSSLAHTQARVMLNYIKLDTWDDEVAHVQLDGQTLFSQSINYTQGPSNQCGSSWPELTVPVDLTISHTANTLTVLATSTLDQAASDESFGIDDVLILIQ